LFSNSIFFLLPANWLFWVCEAEDYFKWSMLLKEEFRLRDSQELSDKEWNHMNIWFFKDQIHFLP